MTGFDNHRRLAVSGDDAARTLPCRHPGPPQADPGSIGALSGSGGVRGPWSRMGPGSPLRGVRGDEDGVAAAVLHEGRKVQ